MTKLGWSIVDSDSIEKIQRNQAGRIFAAYPSVTYILRKGKTTSICVVDGTVPGGLDNTVTHYMTSFR